jgi:hypothetical protein
MNTECRRCCEKLLVGENWTLGNAKNGIRICRVCKAEYNRLYYYDREAAHKMTERYARHAAEKLCRECSKPLIESETWYPSHVKSGVLLCKSCHRAIAKNYCAANKDSVNATRRVYRTENLEYFKQKGREYRQKYPHKIVEKEARRNARKLAQTPPDADPKAILAVYEMAARLTRITGASYHVDHVIPLCRGGQHHQDNLVAMRADWNIRKADQIWPWLSWFNQPTKQEVKK